MGTQQPLCAQDIAERGWGLRCAGYFVTGGTDHQLYSDPKNTTEFNPRTGSAVLASEQARCEACNQGLRVRVPPLERSREG